MNIEDIIKYTSVSSTEIQGKFDSLGFKVSPDGKRLLKCRKELQGVIVVPKGIVSICDEAFKECTGMCGVIFPSSLKYIGRDCFKNRCIEHVDFPNSLKYIGPNAFAKTRLKEIDLNGDGQVDFEEFKKMMIGMNPNEIVAENTVGKDE